MLVGKHMPNRPQVENARPTRSV